MITVASSVICALIAARFVRLTDSLTATIMFEICRLKSVRFTAPKVSTRFDTPSCNVSNPDKLVTTLARSLIWSDIVARFVRLTESMIVSVMFDIWRLRKSRSVSPNRYTRLDTSSCSCASPDILSTTAARFVISRATDVIFERSPMLATMNSVLDTDARMPGMSSAISLTFVSESQSTLSSASISGVRFVERSTRFSMPSIPVITESMCVTFELMLSMSSPNAPIIAGRSYNVPPTTLRTILSDPY